MRALEGREWRTVRLEHLQLFATVYRMLHTQQHFTNGESGVPMGPTEP
jgi:hypothetical protein